MRKAIYLYDQTITLGDQMDYIWRRRFSAVTALFALLHLSTVTGYILYIVLARLTQCQVRALPQLTSMIIKLIVDSAVCLLPHTGPDSVALLTVAQSSLIADILYGLANLVQICTIGGKPTI